MFPCFLQAGQCTKDKFWIGLFEDLAYGITPYGTYFDEMTLCCRFKNKEFNFNFLDKTPDVIYEELYSILRTKLQIISKLEQYNKNVAFKKLLDDKQGKEWCDIKKKNLKDILIENYVINLTRKHGLMKSQMKKLLSIIMIGFQFRVIDNSDVVYDSEQGGITTINGVSIENNKIRLSNVLEVLPEFELCIEPLPTRKMKDYWDKYLSWTKQNI